MAVATEQKTKRWTYEEYYRLDDDKRYEIIDGELLMAPAPDTWHQDWLIGLAFLVRSYVRNNNLGRVFIAPVDVVLDSHNTVQPDLVFVSAKNEQIVQKRNFIAVLKSGVRSRRWYTGP